MGGWNAMRHSLPTADVHSRTFPYSLSFFFFTPNGPHITMGRDPMDLPRGLLPGSTPRRHPQ